MTAIQLTVIFIHYTVTHDTISNSSTLPVSAYIKPIIRRRRYLELTKQKTTQQSIYQSEKDISILFLTNFIKIVKKGVKLDEETIVH
jgi:hypothetical protein